MRIQEQQIKWLIRNYLTQFPGVRENPATADYELFKECSFAANRDIDADDLPSRRTFGRYIADHCGLSSELFPTRVKRVDAERNARSSTVKDLLTALLSGEANYEDVEFWFAHHTPYELNINERVILLGSERIYPVRGSTISTQLVKAFAAGLLYAMNREGFNVERSDSSNTPKPNEIRPVELARLRDAAASFKRRGSAKRVASKVSGRKRQPHS